MRQLARTEGRSVRRRAPPRALAWVWNAFLELRATCWSPEGAAALAPSEIEAWARLRGIEFAPWQVELFSKLDRVFLMERYSKASEPRADA